MKRVSAVTLIGLCVGLGGACGGERESAGRSSVPSKAAATSAAQAETPASAPASDVERFGEPLQPAEVQELSRVLATPDAFARQRITVEGVVRQVCQARGCWLELATGTDPQAEGCRVVMKNHAFFVPTDSAGRRVRVQGEADVKIVPVAQVAHMEQEGGRFSHKAPDGSAQELRILASGIELFPKAGATQQ